MGGDAGDDGVTWEVRNSRQVGPWRRGAGSMPAAVENLPGRGGGDWVAEPGEFALDPAVAPVAVLPARRITNFCTTARVGGRPEVVRRLL